MRHSVFVWIKLVSYLCAAMVLLLVSMATVVPHILFKLYSKLVDKLRDDLQNIDI